LGHYSRAGGTSIIPPQASDQSCHQLSVSILLLIGASIYLLKILVDIVEIAHSTRESENQWVMKGSSMAFLIFLGAWPFSFGLLPQLLWLKNFVDVFQSM